MSDGSFNDSTVESTIFRTSSSVFQSPNAVTGGTHALSDTSPHCPGTATPAAVSVTRTTFNPPAGLALINQQAAIPLQTATVTPTVSQLLNAAIYEYEINATPAGLKTFPINGTQMQMADQFTGADARVWVTPQNQLIIAYRGSAGGENAILHPVTALTGVFTDLDVALRQIPQANADSVQFAKQVLAAGNGQGINSNTIVVTGHSIEAEEASYVAQQTGLGGIAFESTGIPTSSTAVGNGSNFVSVVTNGNVFANYSSDIRVEQAFAPSYVAGGGTFAHWGQLVHVGGQADQTALINTAKALANPITAVLTAPLIAAEVALLAAPFHFPGPLAADLGVTLNPAQLTTPVTVQHGPVLSVASDTISQFQSYALTHQTTG